MIDFGFGAALGPLDSQHRDTIREWRNQYGVWKWCRQNDLISDVAQAAWFERQASDPSIRMYAIHSGEGRVVGVCGLTSIDPINRRAEFSLYIAKQFWGVGLGSSALKTLVTHGFRNLGLHCIWGETFEGNPAAKMFEALGFSHEGTRRDFYFRDGRFIDAHLYSVLESEWGEAKAK